MSESNPAFPPSSVSDPTMNQILSAFQQMRIENTELRAAIAELRAHPQVVPQTITERRPKDPRLPDVETYDGKNVLKAREFVLHLDNFFSGQPNTYGTDHTKLSYASSRLRGTAFSWVTPYLLHNSSQNSSTIKSAPQGPPTYAGFRAEFLRTFGEQDRIVNAEAKLRSLKQGNRSAALLAAELRTYSVDVDWNESALISAFYAGLNEDVKDRLCILDLPSNLNDYLALAVKIDNRLFQRKREMQKGGSFKSSQSAPKSTQQRAPSVNHVTSNVSNDGPQPMVLDTATKKLTSEERARRIREKLCLYCGGAGHAVSTCPNSKRKVVASASTVSSTPTSSGKDNAQA
jgi:hypothetical protein